MTNKRKTEPRTDRRENPRLIAPLGLRIYQRSSAQRLLINTVLSDISQTGLSFLTDTSLRCSARYGIGLSFPDRKNFNAEIDLVNISHVGSQFVHRARFVKVDESDDMPTLLKSIQEMSRVSDRRAFIKHLRGASNGFPTLSSQQISKLAHLPNEAEITARLVRLIEEFKPLLTDKILSPVNFSYRVISHMHQIGEAIGECELAGMARERIVELLKDIRAIFQSSPFVWRIQNWPRGYQGDFETVDYLINQKNLAMKDTLGYFIEQYLLGSMMAQQHRNKILSQSEEIMNTILNEGGNANHPEDYDPRILVLACGSSPDIRRIMPYIQKHKFQIVLNDIDPDALQTSAHALRPIMDRCVLEQGNVFSIFPKLSAHGPFDLVVAGGLLDYLPDRFCHVLFKKVYTKFLKPQGRFVFTNIATGNPFRLWLEYLADWRLIERSEDDISRLLSDLNIEPSNIHIGRDPSRLTIIAQIIKGQSDTVKDASFQLEVPVRLVQ